MARFKVGDRVVAAENCLEYFSKGDAGTVVEDDGIMYRVEFDPAPTAKRKSTGSYDWWVLDVTAEQAPAARANDPATSKGKRKVNKYEQAVLACLAVMSPDPMYKGATGKQIAKWSGHPLNCITPRFAPLRRKGLIKDSGIKRDKQIVWVLV